MKDYYKILDIDKKADKTTIKEAYKKLGSEISPDKNKENKEAAEEKIQRNFRSI